MGVTLGRVKRLISPARSSLSPMVLGGRGCRETDRTCKLLLGVAAAYAMGFADVTSPTQ